MAEILVLTDGIFRWGEPSNYLEISKDEDKIGFSRVEEIEEDPGTLHVVAHLEFESCELDTLENLVRLLDVPYVEACEFLDIDSDPFELLRQILGQRG